ncbi:MAG: hypothetical protein ACRD00_06920, partial [Thermoanaerobaculia bacterium]
MKRSSLTLVLAVLLVAVAALPASAGDRAVVVVGRPGPAGPGDDSGLGRFIACLRILDLSDAQKADIQAILEAAKPILQADADAIKAAAEKLRADVEAGAERCVIGQDYLNLRAAEKKLNADAASVKDQIFSTLTEDQKKKLRGCLEAPRTAASAVADGDGSQ